MRLLVLLERSASVGVRLCVRERCVTVCSPIAPHSHFTTHLHLSRSRTCICVFCVCMCAKRNVQRERVRHNVDSDERSGRFAANGIQCRVTSHIARKFKVQKDSWAFKHVDSGGCLTTSWRFETERERISAYIGTRAYTLHTTTHSLRPSLERGKSERFWLVSCHLSKSTSEQVGASSASVSNEFCSWTKTSYLISDALFTPTRSGDDWQAWRHTIAAGCPLRDKLLDASARQSKAIRMLLVAELFFCSDRQSNAQHTLELLT